MALALWDIILHKVRLAPTPLAFWEVLTVIFGSTIRPSDTMEVWSLLHGWIVGSLECTLPFLLL